MTAETTVACYDVYRLDAGKSAPEHVGFVVAADHAEAKQLAKAQYGTAGSAIWVKMTEGVK